MKEFQINKQNLFKIISGVIVSCVVAAAAIGILLLFSIVSYSDVLGQILLSLLIVFIAGLFLLNSINALAVGNKLGIFAAFMVLVSALLFFVLIWANAYLGDFGEVFSYIIVIVSMVSVFLNLIVGNYIALGRNLLAVQIVLYICFAYAELVISFAILGNDALIKYWQILVAAIIVAFTLYIVLKVKQKNIAKSMIDADLTDKENYVTIPKSEYENLKAEVERLREMVNAKPMGDIPEESAHGDYDNV
ncbi:MAG: hypothetical protein J5911_06380 [Clostridia bacterium]|nr:hypothetical protein [Clostridia bacterium]